MGIDGSGKAEPTAVSDLNENRTNSFFKIIVFVISL
jgi:hypothetical protein